MTNLIDWPAMANELNEKIPGYDFRLGRLGDCIYGWQIRGLGAVKIFLVLRYADDAHCSLTAHGCELWMEYRDPMIGVTQTATRFSERGASFVEATNAALARSSGI